MEENLTEIIITDENRAEIEAIYGKIEGDEDEAS